MAVPVRKKIKHYRGDDFLFTFQAEEYVDPADTSAGTQALDLTGYTSATESNPDVSVTINDGSALDSTGIVNVFVPAEDLGDDQAGTVNLDVQLINPDGFRQTPVHLIVILIDQVQ